ncbi:MAG: hypothetical protein WBA67_08915, partial [Jannaschia sp.]
RDLPDLSLREPGVVMRLARLGCLHQTRLSFMRLLTRRMAAEGWSVARAVFDIDAACVGHAVYTVRTPDRAYSLVAFAHDLPADKRSDRVIAEAWDATFTLFDGVPGDDDIARLAANVPLQEAGRVSERELTLARANRSVRLWDAVVSGLARGRQPEPETLAEVGYLMRTTAMYGSGKFGAADREVYADRAELQAPFQAEMLTVYLIRTFVRDLLNHAAGIRGGANAVALDDRLAASLGIGNSTGLGMAPFLINHPRLLHNWIAARETAIARVCALPAASAPEIALFTDLLARARADARHWHSTHPRQRVRVAQLIRELCWLTHQIEAQAHLRGPFPWASVCRLTDGMEPEAQELVRSLVLEPHGALIDDLAAGLADAGSVDPFDPTMPVADVRALLETDHADALRTDWSAPEACARAWYVSEEKLEPRLGARHAEPIAAFEQPLAPARDAAALHAALTDEHDATPIGMVLLRAPELRAAVRRVQTIAEAPYAEIRDNTIAADLMPIDMLRCKLSFFGATRFDPRSDRW